MWVAWIVASIRRRESGGDRLDHHLADRGVAVLADLLAVRREGRRRLDCAGDRFGIALPNRPLGLPRLDVRYEIAEFPVDLFR